MKRSGVSKRMLWCISLGLVICLPPLTASAQDRSLPVKVPGKPGVDLVKFRKLTKANWEEVMRDPGTKNWKDHWFLDGLKATLTNTSTGMELTAGPEFKNDAHHAVLWTRKSFKGDVKIEYEYTRLDSELRCVNILYIQATGSGKGDYKSDILKWVSLRTVPAMRMYFDHMHTYHISYAGVRADPRRGYIRARRYLPETGKGLKGTALSPDYSPGGLFQTGVPHKITVIKRGNDLYMHIKNKTTEKLCHWTNRSLPPISEGRIGLRHMFTRSARYRNFRVSTLKVAERRAPTRRDSHTATAPAGGERSFSPRGNPGTHEAVSR